jgi:hypothetical protein
MRFRSSRRRFFQSIVSGMAAVLGCAAAAKAGAQQAQRPTPKKLLPPAAPPSCAVHSQALAGTICTHTYHTHGRLVSTSNPMTAPDTYHDSIGRSGASGAM